MNKFTKILILSIFTILMIGGFTKSTFAATPTIQFESNPLFNEVTFAPGVSISRFVKITNTRTANHRSIVRALNVNNTSGLGNMIMFEIRQGTTVLYSNTLSDFLTKSEIVLPTVLGKTTNTIDFIATFNSSADNSYQSKTLSFDLQIGLEDVLTKTVSGISGGSKVISIGNENVTIVDDELGAVIISWTTNVPTTSRVVYGLTSDGPYNLDLKDPNFGYPFSTPEQDLYKTTNHLVKITNLPLDEYSYRVVSQDSPAIVGYEHSFMLSDNRDLSNEYNDNYWNNTPQTGVDDSLSPNIEDNINDEDLNTIPDMEDLNDQNNNLLTSSAGSIMGLPNTLFWGLLIILLLLIILMIRIIFLRRRDEEEKEKLEETTII